MERDTRFFGVNFPSTDRPGRGASVIALPEKYCVVDIETTGLSPAWNDIIEIGAIRYANGSETGRFQTLVQPPPSEDGVYVNSFIENLTGITNAMLSDAPCASDALSGFLGFLGDDLILGYNVGFDVNFLYDNCRRYLNRLLSNSFVDVMRIARRVHRDLPRHRLKDMAAYYGMSELQSHRAIGDCETTEIVYKKLCDEILSIYGDYSVFASSFDCHSRSESGCVSLGVRVHVDKIGPDCPCFQRHFVITGALDRFTRAQAMQLINDLGGISDANVTKKTNYLILGNNDYCATIKGGKSTKQKKAEAYKMDGQDIEIIPETVFYDMIAEYLYSIDSP